MLLYLIIINHQKLLIPSTLSIHFLLDQDLAKAGPEITFGGSGIGFTGSAGAYYLL